MSEGFPPTTGYHGADPTVPADMGADLHRTTMGVEAIGDGMGRVEDTLGRVEAGVGAVDARIGTLTSAGLRTEAAVHATRVDIGEMRTDAVSTAEGTHQRLDTIIGLLGKMSLGAATPAEASPPEEPPTPLSLKDMAPVLRSGPTHEEIDELRYDESYLNRGRLFHLPQTAAAVKNEDGSWAPIVIGIGNGGPYATITPNGLNGTGDKTTRPSGIAARGAATPGVSKIRKLDGSREEVAVEGFTPTKLGAPGVPDIGEKIGDKHNHRIVVREQAQRRREIARLQAAGTAEDRRKAQELREMATPGNLRRVGSAILGLALPRGSRRRDLLIKDGTRITAVDDNGNIERRRHHMYQNAYREPNTSHPRKTRRGKPRTRPAAKKPRT